MEKRSKRIQQTEPYLKYHLVLSSEAQIPLIEGFLSPIFLSIIEKIFQKHMDNP